MDNSDTSLLAAVVRFRRSVVLIVLTILAISTALGFLLRAHGASASSTVALTAPSSLNVLAPGLQGDAALARYTKQRALFVTSDQVLVATQQRLPSTSVTALRRKVVVTPAAMSTSMLVTATASTKKEAVGLVETVVSAYRAETAKQVQERTSATVVSLERDSATLRQTLANSPSSPVGLSAATTLSELTRQSSALQADSAAFSDGVDFVEQATLATTTTPALPVKEIAVGALLGVAVAATSAWLRADGDPRVSTAAQAEVLLDAPLLGKLPGRLDAGSSGVDRAEVTQFCRDIIAPTLQVDTSLVILVTSAERNAGCTTVAAGIATAASYEGWSVLAVDGDPDEKGLTRLLALPAVAPGLVEAVGADGKEVVGMVPVDAPGAGTITALGAGNLAPGQWTLSTEHLHNVIDRLRPSFDLIVIDAPLLVGSYISPVVTSMVDAVLVVVAAGARPAAVDNLGRQLLVNKAPVLGLVFSPGDVRHRRRTRAS